MKALLASELFNHETAELISAVNPTIRSSAIALAEFRITQFLGRRTAPSILIDDLELHPLEGELPKLPLVTPPEMAR